MNRVAAAMRSTNGDGRTSTRSLQPLACDKHPDTDLEVICPRCEPRNGRPAEEVEQEIAECVERSTRILAARLSTAVRALDRVHQLLASVSELAALSPKVEQHFDVSSLPAARSPRIAIRPRQARKAKAPAGTKGARVYAEKQCRFEGCTAQFVPSGPASKFCEEHKT